MSWKKMATAGVTVSLCACTAAWAGASNRVWVSGHGVDHAGCGAPTAPCRSLQYAHDNAAIAGGEIDILDPAGYGAVTITKSISIVNDGVGTAGVQTTSGAAITISAADSDRVYLRGLSIDGVHDAGLSGILYNSAGRLEVINCVIRDFSGDGIQLIPASGFPKIVIANTTIADNDAAGIVYNPDTGTVPTQLVIDQVLINDSQIGVEATPVVGSMLLDVNRSTITNNAFYGVEVGENVVATVDSSVMAMNGSFGVYVHDNGIVHLSRSVVNENLQYGVRTDNTGAIYTTGDNRIFGNGSGVAFGTAPIPESPQ